MPPPDDAALREAVRNRISSPSCQSVALIACETGITLQTLDIWRSQGQK